MNVLSIRIIRISLDSDHITETFDNIECLKLFFKNFKITATEQDVNDFVANEHYIR